ncbi:unnamed protein product [Oncorhynchus mykiss]|uniref:Uncharacterized protein n=1 Tax=Oncorhynchus mykiss TaxID=8022 RepID=A0A060XD92_ONCMY|nr:unnamed protein product [Oncorhynchus mykiss]
MCVHVCAYLPPHESVSLQCSLTYLVCVFLRVCVSALQAALELAEQISTFPQQCMRADRSSALYSVYDAPSFSLALQYEMDHGAPIIQTESVAGATTFSSGTGRGGKFSSKR